MLQMRLYGSWPTASSLSASQHVSTSAGQHLDKTKG
jgi:hypothetical protein